MPIELYPSIAKIKRNGVYENLPGFVPEIGAVATQQMIATAESSATAQYVHNKGEYFRLNDTLYQAIVKINVGDSIVVGTNCEVAVIGNDLSKIANSIANYELGIATSSHNTGDYFMVGETLYVATADIQVGDNISTSTNCRLAVVGDELSGLKTAINKYDGYIIGIPDLVPNVVNGYYINDDGEIVSQASFYYTDEIPVQSGETYELVFYSGTTTNPLRVHGYNSSGTWTGMIDKISAGGGGDTQIDKIQFEVPSGVPFIRISTRQNKPIQALYIVGTNDVNARINSINTRTTQIESVVFQNKNIDFSTIPPQSVDIRETSPFDYISGSNFKYMYFIPVEECKTATLLTTYQYGSYYALLKNNNWEVGQIPAFCDEHIGITVLAKNVPQTITIPSDCNYIAIRIDNQNISAFSASVFITSQSEIDNVKETIETVSKKANVPLNMEYRGLMSAFGNDEHKLRMFGTRNFAYFEEFGYPFKPTKGHESCRDPFLMIYKGAFYVFYTDALNFRDENNSIGVAKTYDFKTYEEYEPIVCNANFKICWAPFVFEENGNYFLSVTGSLVDYTAPSQYMYDLDMDNLTVSNEQVITITGIEKTLDFHFYKFNGLYYAVGKNETYSRTVIANSTTLKGTYAVLADQSYSGNDEEGQTLVRLDNGAYRLYVNDFSTNKVIDYVDIPDITTPTQNVSAAKAIVSDATIDLFHAHIIDMNRAYSFES